MDKQQLIELLKNAPNNGTIMICADDILYKVSDIEITKITIDNREINLIVIKGI